MVSKTTPTNGNQSFKMSFTFSKNGLDCLGGLQSSVWVGCGVMLANMSVQFPFANVHISTSILKLKAWQFTVSKDSCVIMCKIRTQKEMPGESQRHNSESSTHNC